MSSIQIELPSGFRPDHEHAVIAYLTDRLRGQAQWLLLFEAIDLLDQAVAIITGNRITFRTLYQQLFDLVYANLYIDELLALNDVRQQSAMLWAKYARQIVSDMAQRGWQFADVPETRLLLSYLLYWWGAFARGYALEVEVYRDLAQSGITFTAHNLRDPQQRYSPGDLVVSSLLGDIKTSVYFLQYATPLDHDFYIVRLFVENRVYTMVVFLQPSAWDTINGDTVESSLEMIIQHLPRPVRIRYQGHELVVMDYEEWKQRIARQQGAAE
ncbi:MAG: hypothetical protein ACLFVO_29110 [Chloroflexaceae bacterium]